MKRKGKCVLFLVILFVVMALCYCLATFTKFPILSQMKDIWIETAMTTADHQWLATKLFPEYVVNEVMAKKVDDTGVIGVTKFEEYKGLTENTGIHYNIVKTQNTVETLKENRIVPFQGRQGHSLWRHYRDYDRLACGAGGLGRLHHFGYRDQVCFSGLLLGWSQFPLCNLVRVPGPGGHGSGGPDRRHDPLHAPKQHQAAAERHRE